jgi:hypothetical protein
MVMYDNKQLTTYPRFSKRLMMSPTSPRLCRGQSKLNQESGCIGFTEPPYLDTVRLDGDEAAVSKARQ